VRIEGPDQQSVAAEDILAQLRAGLSTRGIDACSGPPSDRPPETATLVIASTQQDASHATIEVRDAITGKRVGREIDLSRTPRDGRALALAVSADELLRATWAELAVSGAPQPRAIVPPAVKAVVDSSLHERDPGVALRLGLGGSVERFAGGMTFFGGDLRAETWFGSRAAAVVSGGYRTSPEATSPLGRVRTSAVHAGLGAHLAVTPDRNRVGADAAIALDAFAVRFDPDPSSGATATAATDWALTATASAGVWAAVIRWVRVRVFLGVDWPIRAVAAAAGSERVMASTGPGVEGGLDVMVVPYP
jgi:hypothetical protein